MELKGKLDTFPLSDVLRFIEQKGHTGYLGLHLEFEENSYPWQLLGPTLDERLIIDHGRLHGLASLRLPHIWCRLLVRGGLIPKSKEKELRERLEWVGDLLLQTLTGLLDVEGGTLRERMELYLRERVAWLFHAREGDFWFEFEQPPPVPPGLEAVPLGELIQQGPDYAQMLKSLFTKCTDPLAIVRVVPVACDAPPPASLPTGEWETLARVNGRRTVKDLLRDGRIAMYETARHLLRLKEQGYIEITSGEETVGASVAVKKGSRISRIKGMLQIGRGTDGIPEDLLGRMCLLVNRLMVQADDCMPNLGQAWEQVLHTHPLASVLKLTEKGFDSAEFEATTDAWGSHQDDWKEIETEAREALSMLLGYFYRDLVHQEGKRGAESIFRRAWQDLPADVLGIPKFEELEMMLPAA